MSAVVPQPMPMGRAILHLCVTDLRRFHWLVTAVVAVEIVRALLTEGSLHLAAPTVISSVGAGAGEVTVSLFDFAIYLVSIVVTAVIVQADHPTHDRAFWRTRPIHPLALAIAKALVLALVLVVVPSVINAVRLVAYGAPWSAVIAASVQIAVRVGSVCVPAWLVAILTRTLTRFLGAALGLLVVSSYLVGLVLTVLSFALRRDAMTGAWNQLFDWQHIALHGWWPALVSTIVAVGILVAHYTVRRTFALLAALLVVVVLPALVPPRDTLEPAPPALARLVANQLRLPLGIQPVYDIPRSSSGTAYATGVIGYLWLPTLPRDISAATRLERPRVQVGGTELDVEGEEQCCAGGDPIAVVAPAQAPGRSPEGLYGGSGYLFRVTGAAVARLSRASAITIDSDATVRFTQHRLVGVVPLAAGQAFRTDRYLLEVLGVEMLAGTTSIVHVRFTRFPTLASASDPQLSFFIGDPTRTRVVSARASWPIVTDGPARTADTWSQGRRWVARAHIPLDSRDPIADPTLYIVESRGIGATTTPLHVHDVPIRALTGGAARQRFD